MPNIWLKSSIFNCLMISSRILGGSIDPPDPPLTGPLRGKGKNRLLFWLNISSFDKCAKTSMDISGRIFSLITQPLIVMHPNSSGNDNSWENMLIFENYSRGKKYTPAYNKSLCKWGHFEKAKTTFKMLLATWYLMCFYKGFRSFSAESLRSVD